MADEEIKMRADHSKEPKRIKTRMSRVWTVLGNDIPRSDVVFIAQMFIICIIVVACIYNLSVGEEKSSLWIALLMSSCSYLIPPPFQLRKKI